MSGWLRNIQGQLTDLANEVLNEANDVLAEATEEVQDPDGEIIVRIINFKLKLLKIGKIQLKNSNFK